MPVESGVERLTAELEERSLLPSDRDRVFQKVLNEAAVPDEDTSDSDRQNMLQRLGMTSHQLASVTGVPAQVIERFIRGRNPGPLFTPSLKKAASIARKAREQQEAYGG